MSLLQGDPLPSVTTTGQEAKNLPEFYTNYLQDIANLGQNAITQGGVAGASPLQMQAYQMAPNMAFAGSGALGQANNFFNYAGNTSSPSIANNYMNPYTQNVVNEMGRLTNRNVQENVMPNLGAAAAGSGQFGSQRAMQTAGNTLRDIQADLTGRQFGALNTGYQNSITNAQADLTRMLTAGQNLGSLGKTQNEIGIGGLKELSALGGEQQALGQKTLDYPMVQAQNFAKLMQNLPIPGSTTTQTTGPGTAGAYGLSTLQQLGGLGTLLAALINSKA